ncbi:hypothetical protein KP509_20G073400 [Ceratopteris richardii]|uniref:Uncharacterized protein n=1 Tax=Ceratopteris richardii TaxID=49495 RepID=A0A8T2SI61_CERRI|nr:hypothetical protein KP509_20G073400 [Ceratopteris richardii]
MYKEQAAFYDSLQNGGAMQPVKISFDADRGRWQSCSFNFIIIRADELNMSAKDLLEGNSQSLQRRLSKVVHGS